MRMRTFLNSYFICVYLIKNVAGLNIIVRTLSGRVLVECVRYRCIYFIKNVAGLDNIVRTLCGRVLVECVRY